MLILRFTLQFCSTEQFCISAKILFFTIVQAKVNVIFKRIQQYYTLVTSVLHPFSLPQAISGLYQS